MSDRYKTLLISRPQVLSSGGSGLLTQANNLSDVADVTTARNNLSAQPLDADLTAYADAADAAARRALIDTPWAYSSALSSGLSAYFIGGTLASADGSALTVASGAVTLPASTTSIVGFDLYDLTFRALPRAIDSAFISIARVVTGASTITSVTPIDSPKLPASRIARTKARLAQGAPVRVLLVGDSITAGTGGTSGNLWFELCFDSAQSAKGYNVHGVANITLTNLGISAANAYNGVGSIARLLAAPATQRQHPSSTYLPTLPQIARAGLTTRAAGANALVRELPDLVIVSLGTNSYGLAKDAELVELTVRGWRALGVEVIIGTTNARTDGNSTLFLDDADAVQSIADTTGSAIADTWAEIAQARLLGTTVTPDGVHPNDTGQLLYARAISRNINSRAQLGESYGPTGLKVFRPSGSTQRGRPSNAAWYQPYQGLSGGATATSSAISNNYNVVVAGQSSSTALASLPVGGKVNFQCHDATAIVLLYELASGSTATIKVASVSGDIKTGISVGGLSSRTCFLEILSFTEMEAVSGALQSTAQRTHTIPAGGFIEVTAITGGATALGVQGFIFPSHASEPLDWRDFEFSGTWAYEAARDDSSIQIPYSDTATSEFIVNFEGDALQLTLQTGSAAGSGATISAWLDGEQILTSSANDPYGGGSSGSFVNNVVLMPNNTGAASGKAFGNRRSLRHTARVRLTAIGSTSGAAQNRNLALLAARVLRFE
jgi:lysophospholipase L1-like esterase